MKVVSGGLSWTVGRRTNPRLQKCSGSTYKYQVFFAADLSTDMKHDCWVAIACAVFRKNKRKTNAVYTYMYIPFSMRLSTHFLPSAMPRAVSFLSNSLLDPCAEVYSSSLPTLLLRTEVGTRSVYICMSFPLEPMRYQRRSSR